MNQESITIAGAGPVGSLLAIILARAGYRVSLFESRPDSRFANIYQGKSINIAMSDRGWMALKSIGCEDIIKQKAIPMYRRAMHGLDGTITHLDYGKKGQAIWSVSRSGINEQLIDLADKEANVTISFEKKLVDVDFETATAFFEDKQESKSVCEPQKVEANYLFAADGAHSKVRRLAHDLPRFSYSQSYMPHAYIELSIPANEDGSFKMEKEALHIWPRKDFMLIALPNPEGSFTCTLFLDYEGEVSFSSLKEKADIQKFFNKNFADAMPLLENPIKEFMHKSPNPLFLVNVDPWIFNNKVALIGDAAHAMVPFYGQGMVCGFEDCRVLAELIETHQHEWGEILPAYHQSRKKNADAITELAKRNFVEMSELSGDPKFLLQKKIEAKFNELYPELWIPLYSMVTFTPKLAYSDALAIGDQQKQIMQQIMRIPDIENHWQEDFVYKKLWELAQQLPKINQI